jgi:hypothetical protein
MDRVKTGCKTCEMNMQGVCAGTDHGYGKPVPDIDDGCPDYEMSFSEFCRLDAKYDKYTGEYLG